jgi:hypothetical protein
MKYLLLGYYMGMRSQWVSAIIDNAVKLQIIFNISW